MTSTEFLVIEKSLNESTDSFFSDFDRITADTDNAIAAVIANTENMTKSTASTTVIV